jgi:hypothetical protein
VWKRLQPRFDLELEKCKTGNYEFSTLAGAYLGNLEYLSTDWLRASIPLMFPSERPANLSAALSGLAYSAATRRSYVMLRDATVVDSALRIEAKGRDTRKMLVERIMLAYLWGDETLESPRVSYLFQNGLVDDLQAAGWFFSTVRGDRLSPEQRAKVVAFWNRCITWAQGQATPPDKLLGTLAALAWSLDDAQGRNGELLLAVAPYKNIDHGSYEFLEELLRLANTSPTTVALVVGAMIKTSSQMYDYKGVLKSLLATLAQLGQRAVVLQYCDQLRQVDGIPELFTRLRSEVH